MIPAVGKLQEYILTQCQSACSPKILSTTTGSCNIRQGLLFDAEACIVQLYGGFYPDWACGGQWNKLAETLLVLARNCFLSMHGSAAPIVIFFNGAYSSCHFNEWFHQQTRFLENIENVLHHVKFKATHPPKIWWTTPIGFNTCLRLAAHDLGVTTQASLTDHGLEMVLFCRENLIDGVVTTRDEVFVFGPRPRYFLAETLKIKYRVIMADEVVLDKVARCIDLSPQRFHVLVALLGNHILVDKELSEFYCRLLSLSSVAQLKDFPAAKLVQALLDYVRQRPSVKDLDDLCKDVFDLGNMFDKKKRLKLSIEYYLNGTEEAFQRTRRAQGGNRTAEPGSYASYTSQESSMVASNSSICDGGDRSANQISLNSLRTATSNSSYMHVQKPCDEFEQCLALEFAQFVAVEPSQIQESKDVKAAKEDDDNFASDEDLDKYVKWFHDTAEVPEYTELASGYLSSQLLESFPSSHITRSFHGELSEKPQRPVGTKKARMMDHDGIQSRGNDDKLCSSEDPARCQSETSGLIGRTIDSEESLSWDIRSEKGERRPWWTDAVSSLVLSVVQERHCSASMHPWIYQLLTQGEIWLPVCMEDRRDKSLPYSVDLYRSVRHSVYCILFSITDKSSVYAGQTIREWTVNRSRTGEFDRLFTDVQLGCGEDRCSNESSIEHLWNTQTVNEMRISAFLSCMNCDDIQQELLNRSTILPIHFVLCVVLRYMLRYKHHIFSEYELNAFLATAVSNKLHCPVMVQDINLPIITVRGLQLAALFMLGVEHAVLANDVVGLAMPATIFAPWKFFDGKLFHYKLMKAKSGEVSIKELCEDSISQVMSLERMKNVILSDLSSPFILSGWSSAGSSNSDELDNNTFMYNSFKLLTFRSSAPFHTNAQCHSNKDNLQMYPAGYKPQPPSLGDRIGIRARRVGNIRHAGGSLEIAGLKVSEWSSNPRGSAGFMHRMVRGMTHPCFATGLPHSFSYHPMLRTSMPAFRNPSSVLTRCPVDLRAPNQISYRHHSSSVPQVSVNCISIIDQYPCTEDKSDESYTKNKRKNNRVFSHQTPPRLSRPSNMTRRQLTSSWRTSTVKKRLIIQYTVLQVSVPANEFYGVTKNVGLKSRSNAGTSTDLGHCGANLNMCIMPGLGRGRGCTVEFVDDASDGEI